MGVNRLVKYFILSDMLLLGGWGLIEPVFSIFIVDKIPGATVITVGAASAIYWIVKSLLQVPVAVLIDRKRGERDDFYALLLSLFLSGVGSFAFVLVRSVPLLYWVVLIKAVAFAFYIPSWYAIFSRHLDQKRRAFDWAFDSTGVGVAAGVTGFFGGSLVQFFGFQVVFVAASTMSFLAFALLLMVPNLVLPPAIVAHPVVKDHSARNIAK